jgi:hypothetical protein
MKKLIEFPLEDGNHVIIEVDEEESGPIPAGRGERPVLNQQTLEEALQKVFPAIKAVAQKLGSLDLKPDEVEIAFGIKLSTSLGALIASAGAEANFDITLRWSGDHAPER